MFATLTRELLDLTAVSRGGGGRLFAMLDESCSCSCCCCVGSGF